MADAIAYDLDTAAQMVGVSRRELQRLITVGDITARYAGARHTKPLIPHAELEAYLASLPTTRKGD